ncbi:MAG: SRPBCC domain-containing protein [Gammaproteobacteria bacterium]
MIEPVEVSVVLNTPQDAAFAAFVEQINRWWPVASHSICGGTVMMEPGLDGKIIETAADGTTHQWGHVTPWDAPNHLAISWYVGAAPVATAFTVDFAATDDGGTHVTLVHTGWDALGEDGVAQRGNYQHGWTQILGSCYANFVANRGLTRTGSD